MLLGILFFVLSFICHCFNLSEFIFNKFDLFLFLLAARKSIVAGFGSSLHSMEDHYG